MNNCSFEVSPYSKSNSFETSNFSNINYTNQDFWSLKARLVSFIQERFGVNGTELPNTFNDLVESSIAIMLMENWAFIGDTLSFKMDQQFNEIFMTTVTQLDNAFRIVRGYGFKPTPPIAAISYWTATLNAPVATDISISTPISISLPSPTAFNTSIELFPADSNNQPIFNQDIIISAGQTVNQTIVGIEGRTINQEASGSGVAGQSISLSSFPVLLDSIQVSIDGNTWSQVDYFTDSQPRKEYRLEFNSQYQAFVVFGNNRAGMIPSLGSRVLITYRVGGGPAGNIVTGAIEYQKQAFVPGLKFSVPISFRNYTAGQYGYAGDGLEDIRRKLPQWVQTQQRMVSPNDFKILCEQFVTPYNGQVGKATAILRNHGCSGNIIDVYVLANNSGVLQIASDGLKSNLNDYIDANKMLTDHVCIRDGSILNTDVLIDLTLDRINRKFEAEVNDQINRLISIFFNLNNWDFNDILKDVDIIKALSSIKQIKGFNISFVTQNGETGNAVVPKFYEIVQPDNINISFVYE
jgi:hypothetical protein